jgi:hypothetical protein
MSTDNRKVIRESDNYWQLDGESILVAITLPDPPQPGAPTTVRLTHSNCYGPCDEADLFVRRGNPDQPTAQDDLDSHHDWVKTRLVEELVTVGDDEILRSEADPEDFEDEIPWEGTYEAPLVFPAGRSSIEIKIISQRTDLLRSMVLADWQINAG